MLRHKVRSMGGDLHFITGPYYNQTQLHKVLCTKAVSELPDPPVPSVLDCGIASARLAYTCDPLSGAATSNIKFIQSVLTQAVHHRNGTIFTNTAVVVQSPLYKRGT